MHKNRVDKTIFSSLISAFWARNVVIGGGGTIDGRGNVWWAAHKQHLLNYTRPRLLEPYTVTNVVIRDIDLRDSPFWTVHPYNCTNVRITNVRIINPSGSPNTDGIDPGLCLCRDLCVRSELPLTFAAAVRTQTPPLMC